MKYLLFSAEKYVKLCCLILSFCCIQTTYGIGQCALSCHGTTQVSLSDVCDAEITPNMILSDNGLSCSAAVAAGTLYVEVSDEYGVITGGNIVTNDHMGQTLSAMVIDSNTGNSCWGYIIIEDKLGPTITDCPMGFVTMDCADMNVYPGPEFTDNCNGVLEPVLLSESFDTPCLAGIIKRVTRVYSAVDSKGNQSASTCTVRFQLKRFNEARVRYPEDEIEVECDSIPVWDLNANGTVDENEIPTSFGGVPYYITLFGGVRTDVDLFPYPDVYCNTVVTFEDIILPKIGCTQKVMRRWSINEWHCSGEMTYTYLQTFSIVDNEGPIIDALLTGECLINGESILTLTTNKLIAAPGSGSYGDFNCGAELTVPKPTATDNCSSQLHFDLTYNSGFVANYTNEKVTLPMGTSTILFTVYDECYNSSQCHLPVEIIDNTPPIAICDQNTTVSVTNGGAADIRAHSFDDGSYDDCKLHCAIVRRMNNRDCECRIPEICDLDYIGNYGGSNYYLSSYNTTGNIAKARATAYGGSLAIFNSTAEEEWVNTQTRNKYAGNYWIGLKRLSTTFLWDDHTALSYNNFPGTIMPTTGDCVVVNSNNEWEALNCTSSLFDTPLETRYLLEIPEGCGFSSSVKYCCADVGAQDEMVVFRVVDFYGNYNDCMVNVFVQDKSAPTLNCPPHQTVECDYIYNASDLDYAFGALVIGENCGSTIVPTVDTKLSECGIGTITRLWTAVASPTDNSELAHCKQIITFINSDLFDGDLNLVCPVQDTVIIGCNDPADFGPEVMGVPQYTSGQCDILGADFDDQLFTFNNDTGDACFKILRNWEVIDWCRINPVTNTYYRWTCAQVIKIASNSRPIVTDSKQVDICSYEPNCTGGPVQLQAFGEDGCTAPENLEWTYHVYLGSNGFPTSFIDIPDHTASGQGHIASLDLNMPIGSHIVRWTFYNGCGSATTQDQKVTVSNCKAATAYCLNGLAVDLMPIDSNNDGTIDDGMIELWASDFDAGSSHPCNYEVHLSFSADVNETNKTFRCSNLDGTNGVGNQLVEIWATVYNQVGDPIQTYCTAFVDIQDNMGACGQLRPQANVNGNITTEMTQTVSDVQVTLEGSTLAATTGLDGQYAFPSMPTGGDYVISPSSNHGPLNGVSTLDLIIIQRHILGLEKLDSPYKMIAADVDANKTIDGIDLVELRKLILGIYDELPENDSWRFVDGAYTFTNSINPLAENYPEDYEIRGLNNNMDVDFIAVKIGDVNDTAIANLREGVTSASASAKTNITLGLQSESISEYDITSVPFTIERASSVLGFQFALNYDTDLIDVLDVSGVNIDLDESNYLLQNGAILISWDSKSPVTNASFELSIRAKKNGQLSEAFSLANGVRAEVYGSDLNITTPILKGSGEYAFGNDFELQQNNPNPFSNATDVTLNLVNNEKVTFTLTDVQGRIVNTFNRDLNQGANTIRIQKEDLGHAGIYYLNVMTEQNNKTIKMVLIN